MQPAIKYVNFYYQLVHNFYGLTPDWISQLQFKFLNTFLSLCKL